MHDLRDALWLNLRPHYAKCKKYSLFDEEGSCDLNTIALELVPPEPEGGGSGNRRCFVAVVQHSVRIRLDYRYGT